MLVPLVEARGVDFQGALITGQHQVTNIALSDNEKNTGKRSSQIFLTFVVTFSSP